MPTPTFPPPSSAPEPVFDVYLDDRGGYVSVRIAATGASFALPWPALSRFAQGWIKQGLSLSNWQ